MKKHITIPALLLFGLMFFYSCKKDQDNNNNHNIENELETHNDDAQFLSQNMDDVLDEANLMVEENPMLAGKTAQTYGSICGATRSFDSASKTITVVYNGNNCNNTVFRTGKVYISISQNKKWKDSGAVLSIQFDSLKITRLNTNRSIIINGVHTVTNVTGGKPFWVKIPASGYTQVIHLIQSNNMEITFDNGSKRSWNVAKKRTFTAVNNKMVITTIGTHSLNGNNNISYWGVNRFGNNFSTSVTEPMQVEEACSFRLTKGAFTHEVNGRSISVTFGLDASGQPTSCPSGNYYMKIVWTDANGNTQTLIKPY